MTEDDATPHEPLDELRARIDRIDRRLVELLAERARIAVEIGALKRARHAPVYAPDREAALLARLRTLDRGPLPEAALEAIFREIMSSSLLLERPPRVGYVGPAGSYGHAAARRHFGAQVRFEDVRSAEAVGPEIAAGNVDHGLLPLDPTLPEAPLDVPGTLVALPDGVFACGRLVVDLPDALLAACEPDEVRVVHGTAFALARARAWLATQYPGATLRTARSTAEAVAAARRAVERSPGAGAAALAPTLAGSLHGLPVLLPRVGATAAARLEFVLLGTAPATPGPDDRLLWGAVVADAPALGDLLAAAGAGDRTVTWVRLGPVRPAGGRAVLVETSAAPSDPPVPAAPHPALRPLGRYPAPHVSGQGAAPGPLRP